MHLQQMTHHKQFLLLQQCFQLFSTITLTFRDTLEQFLLFPSILHVFNALIVASAERQLLENILTKGEEIAHHEQFLFLP